MLTSLGKEKVVLLFLLLSSSLLPRMISDRDEFCLTSACCRLAGTDASKAGLATITLETEGDF